MLTVLEPDGVHCCSSAAVDGVDGIEVDPSTIRSLAVGNHLGEDCDAPVASTVHCRSTAGLDSRVPCLQSSGAFERFERIEFIFCLERGEGPLTCHLEDVAIHRVDTKKVAIGEAQRVGAVHCLGGVEDRVARRCGGEAVGHLEEPVAQVVWDVDVALVISSQSYRRSILGD